MKQKSENVLGILLNLPRFPFHLRVRADHAMHDRNVLPLHVVDHDLAEFCPRATIPEEQKVTALEGGFHRAGEDDL